MAQTEYAGVDLSVWNANVDYKTLKGASIEGRPLKFAMLRLSYGTTMDKRFAEHYKGCKAAGILVGCYHWLKSSTVSGAKREAEYVVKLLRAGGYEMDYPVALDFEDSDLFGLGLSKTQYTALVDAFLVIIKEAGYYPILYTNPAAIETKLDKTVIKRWDLWLAHWVTKPAQYGQTMWQYAALGTSAEVSKQAATRVGHVDGVKGAVDVNISYVGYAAKIRKFKNSTKLETNNSALGNYTIVAVKSAVKNSLSTEQKKLKAMGYSVVVLPNKE